MHVRLQRVRETILERHLPMIDSVVERNMKNVDPHFVMDYKGSQKRVYTLAVDTTLKELDGMLERKEINLDR